MPTGGEGYRELVADLRQDPHGANPVIVPTPVYMPRPHAPARRQ